MATFKLSPEQHHNLALFDTGEDLMIQAGAGCGKTSEIVRFFTHMAATRPVAMGIYVALQKTLAQEVQGSITSVNVAFAGTIHSLAWTMLRHTHPEYMAMVAARMPRKKRGPNDKPPLPAYKKPEVVGLVEGVIFTREGKTGITRSKVRYGKPVVALAPDDVWLSPYMLYQAAIDTVRRFCMSGEDTITLAHALSAVTVKRSWAVPHKNRKAIAAVILTGAQGIWADALNSAGQLPYNHDWYLKFWSLCKPDLMRDGGLAPGSVLFFDEAQDSKPCVSAVIEHQRTLPGPRIQIVTVGDSAQAIFGFTGARDALRDFAAWKDAHHGSLSVSWRFHQGIADEANILLDLLHAPIRLTGNPHLAPPAGAAVRQFTYDNSDGGLSEVATSQVDAVICRTNREVITAVTPLVSAGLRVYADADTSTLRNLAADLVALRDGRSPESQDMKVFSDYKALAAYLKDAEVDDELAATLSKIIDLDPVTVLAAMNQVTSRADDADVTVSTIHKAKGKQWDSVVVVMDPEKVAEKLDLPAGHREREDVLMLTYVALTRARTRLYVPDDLFYLYRRQHADDVTDELSEAVTRAAAFAA